MSDLIYIYALIDPRDFSYRYIGKTIDPERRERNHLQYAADPQVPKDWWVRKLLEMGEEPIFRVIMEVPDECWAEAEISTIAYFRQIGAPLLNLTDGGDGLHGYEWNEEQRARLGEVSRQRWRDPEFRAKSMDAIRNRDLSYLEDPEFHEMLSGAARRRWENPEYRARHLEGVRASWTPERLEEHARAQQERCQDPEVQRAMAESTSRCWRDPEYRRRHQEGMANCGIDFSAKAKEKWADPEFREKHAEAVDKARHKVSAHSQACWADPEYRSKQEAAKPEKSAKIKAKLAEKWEDEEFVAKQRAADEARRAKSKALWADPEYRAKQAAARKRRRAEKLAAQEREVDF